MKIFIVFVLHPMVACCPKGLQNWLCELFGVSKFGVIMPNYIALRAYLLC